MASAPETDSPTSFYFNGILMPKWGNHWGPIMRFFDPQAGWDHEFGARDVYLVYTRIDHVGVVESEDPDVFIYVIQEVIIAFLENRNLVLEGMRSLDSILARNIYHEVIKAAFQMRDLTVKERMAFWISGNEMDQKRLLEEKDRSLLNPADPQYQMPPHRRRLKRSIQWSIERQVTKLHCLAQAGGLEKNFRKILHDFQAPEL